jgi:magnesium transporter
MDPGPPVVTPDTDQEHAAWQAVHRNETGLGVVDDDGRFPRPDRALQPEGAETR